MDFTSFLSFRGWLCPLKRCVGKQTPAAPELQLRDVVWSDESWFRLREEPNHQNTRIANGGKHPVKVKGAHFEKMMHFFDVHCSQNNKQIPETQASNNMHFWSIHWVFSFLEPKTRTRAHFGGPVFRNWVRKNHSEFSRGPKGSRPAGHPVSSQLVHLRACSLLWDCGKLLDGEVHVWSPSASQGVFRRLCESWSNHSHPEELPPGAPSLKSFYLDCQSVSSFEPAKRFRRDSTRSALIFPRSSCLSW